MVKSNKKVCECVPIQKVNIVTVNICTVRYVDYNFDTVECNSKSKPQLNLLHNFKLYSTNN